MTAVTSALGLRCRLRPGIALAREGLASRGHRGSHVILQVTQLLLGVVHQAIAQVEYSCEPMAPGDTLIPFAEKTHLTLRDSGRLDRFAPPNGKTTGRLVLARDFDSFLGTGSKVYLNVGANQGVKVGDYFKAVRPYWMDRDDEVDSISLSATVVEDTQLHPPSIEPAMFTKDGSGPTIHLKEYPRRAVGELLILNVTPTSSTGMVIFALEDVHLGDFAELE